MVRRSLFKDKKAIDLGKWENGDKGKMSPVHPTKQADGKGDRCLVGEAALTNVGMVRVR